MMDESTPWVGLAASIAMFALPPLPDWLFEGPRTIKHRPRRHVRGECGALWANGHSCPVDPLSGSEFLHGELRRMSTSTVLARVQRSSLKRTTKAHRPIRYHQELSSDAVDADQHPPCSSFLEPPQGTTGRTTMADLSTADWHKSSRSGMNGCVEVALLAGAVAVRDSKDRGGPVLLFTADEWEAFVGGVRDGQFDKSG